MIRTVTTGIVARRVVAGRRAVLECIRLYSVPQRSRTGNFLVNALKYVKDVDKYQEELVKNALTNDKTSYLMDQIKNSKELLYLLAVFHHELSKLGVSCDSDPVNRQALLWKYRLLWILKLNRIHNVFWEACQVQDISEQDHALSLNPAKIGILDPYNFKKEDYDQLQTGEFNGIDFRNLEIITFSNPFRKA